MNMLEFYFFFNYINKFRFLEKKKIYNFIGQFGDRKIFFDFGWLVIFMDHKK